MEKYNLFLKEFLSVLFFFFIQSPSISTSISIAKDFRLNLECRIRESENRGRMNKFVGVFLENETILLRPFSFSHFYLERIFFSSRIKISHSCYVYASSIRMEYFSLILNSVIFFFLNKILEIMFFFSSNILDRNLKLHPIAMKWQSG